MNSTDGGTGAGKQRYLRLLRVTEELQPKDALCHRSAMAGELVPSPSLNRPLVASCIVSAVWARTVGARPYGESTSFESPIWSVRSPMTAKVVTMSQPVVSPAETRSKPYSSARRACVATESSESWSETLTTRSNGVVMGVADARRGLKRFPHSVSVRGGDRSDDQQQALEASNTRSIAAISPALTRYLMKSVQPSSAPNMILAEHRSGAKLHGTVTTDSAFGKTIVIATRQASP
jgi:hypothetical protein